MTAYRTLDIEGWRAYLASTPDLASRLGGRSEGWQLREVSDGNLNNVFLVSGPLGGLCCKQSLPHVRVDPDWKMPLTRTDFEARYMRAVAPHVGHLMPALYHFDPDLHLLAMESLTPHRVLRGALATGVAAAGFSARIGEYVGRAAFLTSWRARPFEAVTEQVAAFAANTTLTRITVDLVLTAPYRAGCKRNHWLSPELDDIVGELQSDPQLASAVSRLQERFLTAPQALLHGDLHTGSIMVDGDDVRVIDGEFALYGPIGFDAGLYVGNLLLHAAANPGRLDWMCDEIETFWRHFERNYRTLWSERGRSGDIGALLDDSGQQQAQVAACHAIMKDLTGFAGLEMIRRTIGYAQVSDYDARPNRAERAEAMREALMQGRALILHAGRTETPGALLDLITL
ncbi:methylthioribose kinase [Neoasaia chiangmaiensis NBRC 101099]|uniref:S-methyl-5-thioribose kinase n=1 Tax=Neoasaia chiangmaiensis TaxID=320497 RepID=A0A1U9KR96_9PROT|nr:S-methyl-5-thioribose kinase [Neoasaia chiangmaiensis]AQS88326.1 hypothetical protein A0U93_10660 [Neoasaia chiangmaiensis]GBR39533.1 methylthioribose kinase [Neoasaia chiangmaiensis NBRC 101099]GEN14626.1 methylthioribose kinase [Neoasaia chiangmaiensis]